MAQRTLALTPSESTTPNYKLHAVLELAAAEVHGGKRLSPERGFHRIKSWLPRASYPEYASWILSDMAKYLAMAGQGETALELGAQAIEVTYRQSMMRLIDQSFLLMVTGYPGRALEQMPSTNAHGVGILRYEALIQCEAHLALGERESESDNRERYIILYRDSGSHRLMSDGGSLFGAG